LTFSSFNETQPVDGKHAGKNGIKGRLQGFTGKDAAISMP
jgi:hypothetical protein